MKKKPQVFALISMLLFANICTYAQNVQYKQEKKSMTYMGKGLNGTVSYHYYEDPETYKNLYHGQYKYVGYYKYGNQAINITAVGNYKNGKMHGKFSVNINFVNIDGDPTGQGNPYVSISGNAALNMNFKDGALDGAFTYKVNRRGADQFSVAHINKHGWQSPQFIEQAQNYKNGVLHGPCSYKTDELNMAGSMYEGLIDGEWRGKDVKISGLSAYYVKTVFKAYRGYVYMMSEVNLKTNEQVESLDNTKWLDAFKEYMALESDEKREKWSLDHNYTWAKTNGGYIDGTGSLGHTIQYKLGNNVTIDDAGVKVLFPFTEGATLVSKIYAYEAEELAIMEDIEALLSSTNNYYGHIGYNTIIDRGEAIMKFKSTYANQLDLEKIAPLIAKVDSQYAKNIEYYVDNEYLKEEYGEIDSEIAYDQYNEKLADLLEIREKVENITKNVGLGNLTEELQNSLQKKQDEITTRISQYEKQKKYATELDSIVSIVMKNHAELQDRRSGYLADTGWIGVIQRPGKYDQVYITYFSITNQLGEKVVELDENDVNDIKKLISLRKEYIKYQEVIFAIDKLAYDTRELYLDALEDANSLDEKKKILLGDVPEED